MIQHADVQHWHKTKHIYDNDMDVILENSRLLKRLRIKFVPTHVHGHQDRIHDHKELSAEAKLNIRMDELASEFLKSPPEHLTPSNKPVLFPAQQVCIVKNDTPLQANIINELVFGEKQVIIEHYFHKHFGITKTTINLVDWRCFNYVLPKQKNKKQLIKGLHHLWNTISTTFKWGKSKSNICPLCSKCTENWEHVFKCTNEHIVRARSDLIQTLDNGLRSLHTHLDLQKWLINGIKAWLSGNEFGEPASYNITNLEVLGVYEAQHEVGFGCFMQGLIATEMREVQSKYYKRMHYPVKYNGVRWMKYLITTIMTFGHDLWKERCAIVHAGTSEVYERRTRADAWEKLIELKRDTWKIPTTCRDILRRDNFFFMKAPFLQIEMWMRRVESAIEQGKNVEGIHDIREYGIEEFDANDENNHKVKRVRANKKYPKPVRQFQKKISSYCSDLKY